MKILFLHPNIPGQYKNLCMALGRDPNHQLVFVSRARPDVNIPGVTKIEYKPARAPSPYTHRYLVGAERAVLQGQEVWRACKKLKEEGFTPDVICAHPGWGDAMYVKDIYRDTPLLSFFEFYYHSTGSDVGFDPANPTTDDDRARVRTKNITNLLSLESADWGITPTHWQHKQQPPEFQHKITVLHDGINTELAQPNPRAQVNVQNVSLTQSDEVVTYIARNFEPYRGFPTFMRAAKRLLESRPNLHIIAVGADGVSYGRQRTDNTTYRKQYMQEVGLEKYSDRLHFVGMLPYDSLLRVMQISSAHIYLTYPFVLSWSMLEAMACGCVMIGSRTPPVEEVITHGVNGLLADFFSPESVAGAVTEALTRKDDMRALRTAARQTVLDRYDIRKLLPLHVSLIADVASRRLPPPTHRTLLEQAA